jgi:hypothetical protein
VPTDRASRRTTARPVRCGGAPRACPTHSPSMWSTSTSCARVWRVLPAGAKPAVGRGRVPVVSQTCWPCQTKGGRRPGRRQLHPSANRRSRWSRQRWVQSRRAVQTGREVTYSDTACVCGNMTRPVLVLMAHVQRMSDLLTSSAVLGRSEPQVNVDSTGHVVASSARCGSRGKTDTPLHDAGSGHRPFAPENGDRT